VVAAAVGLAARESEIGTARLVCLTPGMDGPLQHRLPDPLVTADLELQSGVSVFAGTRVPIKNLFDYLEQDLTLAAFLDDFPNVTRDHAVAVLETARLTCFPSAARVRQEAAA
jgi:uncharacterized protein (DUF433 family)